MGPQHTESILRRSISGAIAGLTATAAMSAALGIADGVGVMKRQPPRIIVETLFPGLTQAETKAVALLSHLGYGTAASVAYALIVAPVHRNTRTGALFGTAVWAAGYQGWLPLFGILPPAHRDMRGRALTMLVAHIIYGAALGRASRRETSGRSSSNVDIGRAGPGTYLADNPDE